MPRDREELRWMLEDRLSTVSRWLAARRDADEREVEQLREDLDSMGRELREHTAASVRDAVARARATVDDMDRELDAPRRPGAVTREELDAMRRHVRLTSTLVAHLSNLDDPGWGPAREEYERSWDEIHRAMERGATPSRGARRPFHGDSTPGQWRSHSRRRASRCHAGSPRSTRTERAISARTVSSKARASGASSTTSSSSLSQ